MRWLATRLRYVADRIDPKGAPRHLGYSFRFVFGHGIEFTPGDSAGCDDYDQAFDDLRPDQQTGGLPVPPADSIDPLDGFTLGYDRGYIGIGLHCATCTDQAGDIAGIEDGTPLADVIELATAHVD